MLKLSIITNNVYAFGGGEKWSLELAKRLATKFEITIISMHSRKEIIRKAKEQLEKEYDFKKFNLIDLYSIGVKSSAFGEEEYTLRIPEPKTVATLFNTIKNSDIVYQVSMNPVIFFYSIIFSKMLNKKIILGIHNPVFFKIFEDGSPGGWLLRMLLSQIRYFHVLNEDDLKMIRAYVPAAKTYKISIFITKNPERIRTNKGEFIVLYVGRLAIDQKGIDLLEKVIRRMAENSKIRFHIVGAGGEGTKIVEKLCREYPNKVSYFGFLDDRKLEIEYKKSNLFILTSRYEGLPAVVIEAQTHGLPLVAFDVKGPTDIIRKSVQGTLIKPFDTDAFAREIFRYMDMWQRNKRKYADRKMRIQKETERYYEQNKVIREMEEMFTRVSSS